MRVRATLSSTASICPVHASTFQVAREDTEFNIMGQWWGKVIECKDCRMVGVDTLRISLRPDSDDSEEQLRGIALWELNHGNHGSFLKPFLEAYLAADPMNGKLLDEPMRMLVAKYKLEDGQVEENKKVELYTEPAPAAN